MNRAIEKFLEKQLKDTLEHYLIQADGKTPLNLAESIRYSLLAPGKRIRPRLLLSCAEMLGLSAASTTPAALALEMLHCFTLIHDDLPCMDNDDFRRGMPSNHKKFGENMALLAGDALMILAVDLFLDSKIADAQALRSGLKRFIWAAGPRGVIGGQASESLLGKHSSLEDLRQMHYQKTGTLFSAALLIPKDFAGISDDSEAGRTLISFAYELGVAFQIADDLEDANPKGQPTHILFYISASEASQITLRNLNAACDQLVQIWGEKAQGLKQISNEVLKKIETAMGILV
jgi:geranylgeranyl diphosphate synthase type II